MYVAITRARKRLYLSHSQTRMLHGQTRYNLKSRFFDELPEHCLKWVTPKQAGFASGMGTPWTPAGARHSQGAQARPSWGNSGLGSPSVSADTWKSPPVPVQKSEPGHGIKAGIQVFHAKFGEGKVLAVEGTGADARAQVNFPRHGVKWLALSVAKLTVV
jgi:DNA helicase-2/ATP-dependent DNA helicase PcrA